MTVFAHAVASFDPTSTSVLLWTRLSGGESVGWVVASDPGLEQVVRRGEAQTGADRDYTLVVEVEGLEPATTYWYQFRSGEERSPAGRTRTLPAGRVPSFSIGMVSCARYSVAPLTVYRALAQAEVDLVLHLGDYIYDDEGDKGPRSHEPHRVAVSLDDYRQRLAQIRRDPDCQALHLRHPVCFLWDDHDFADNAWLHGAKSHDAEEHGPWIARRDASVQAHREWLPCRGDIGSDPLVIYRSFPIGDLAELVLIDSRLVGRESQASVPGAKSVNDPTRSILGDRQMEWLKERLAGNSRRWSLVAGGVVVNPIPMELPFPRLTRPLLPEGYVALEDGRVLRDDQWDGYPAERERLVEAIARGAHAGVRTVLLSGDVHSSWAFEGPAGPDGTPVALEVTVPSVSSAPMGRTRLPAVWRLLDSAARKMDHVRWAEITARGYTVVQILPNQIRVGWWFVDPYDLGEVPRTRVGAAYQTLHGWWPPRWRRGEAPETPADRIPLPELAPRPADVAYVRRWHKRRRFGVLALLWAVVGSLILGLVVLVRRLAGLRD